MAGKFIFPGICFVFTFLLPGLTALYLKRKGIIPNLEMDEKSHRKIPFLMTSSFYLLCFYVFKWLHAPALFDLMLLGATSVVFLVTLISFYWKISIHASGIGGISGCLLSLAFAFHGVFEAVFPVSILLGGIICAVRLKLSAHEPAQVYLGFMAGFLVQFLVTSMGT